MRIAFISTMEGVPWGGSEMLWSQASLYLASQGHHIAVSVKQWPTTPDPVLRLQRSIANVSFRKSWQKEIQRSLYERIQSRFFKKSVVPSSMKWLSDFRPDLVCVSDGAVTGGVGWLNYCMENSLPYVALSQANYEAWWPEDRQLDFIRKVFANARRAFFVSDGNLKLFEQQIAFSLSNAEVVWNPFNVRWEASPGWPESASEKEVWDLACVGRLHLPSKGQDLIIKVLSQSYWRERPIMVTFYGAGEHEKGLRELVQQQGLAKVIKFGGHVEEIESLWSKHQALLLPSRYEGMPLAVIEAMLCRRIPIVTKIAGNPELVDHGRTGFLIDAPTFDSLDRTLEEAWQRRNDWKNMGDCAGDSIRKKIPKEPAIRFAERLLEIASNRL